VSCTTPFERTVRSSVARAWTRPFCFDERSTKDWNAPPDVGAVLDLRGAGDRGALVADRGSGRLGS
jgi:hypothetical protein